MWIEGLGGIFIAYLMGSLPFAKWIAECQGIDLREKGSGNLGTTNVYRCMGAFWAIIVLILDISKAAIPTWVSLQFLVNPWWHIGIGLTAVLGHSYSVFAQFKGGKGVASTLGVLMVLSPAVSVLVGVVGVGLVGLTKRVSVASLVGAILAPMGMAISHAPQPYLITMMGISGIVLYRHRSNITRLLIGTEPRLGQKDDR